MNFYFSIYIKSIDETLYFREFNLIEFKEIQKCIVNENYISFNYTITKLINQLCQSKINSDEFTFFERIKTFLIIYSYSVDYTKTFKSYENGKKITKELDIFGILDFFEDNITPKEFQINDISLKFGNLNSSYIGSNFELFDFLESIIIEHEEYFSHELGRDMFKNIINSFEGKDLKQVYEFIQDVVDGASSTKIFEIFDENGDDISLNLIMDKTHIFKIALLIVKEDLNSVYELFFNLNQILNIPFNDFKLLTQRESKILVQIYNAKEEQKKREEQTRKNSTPSVNF